LSLDYNDSQHLLCNNTTKEAFAGNLWSYRTLLPCSNATKEAPHVVSCIKYP
jgi:hypothetical protein